ncbi:hypothetical protein V8E36_005186 [Tilletia maclaganii]
MATVDPSHLPFKPVWSDALDGLRLWTDTWPTTERSELEALEQVLANVSAIGSEGYDEDALDELRSRCLDRIFLLLQRHQQDDQRQLDQRLCTIVEEAGAATRDDDFRVFKPLRILVESDEYTRRYAAQLPAYLFNDVKETQTKNFLHGIDDQAWNSKTSMEGFPPLANILNLLDRCDKPQNAQLTCTLLGWFLHQIEVHGSTTSSQNWLASSSRVKWSAAQAPDIHSAQ